MFVSPCGLVTFPLKSEEWNSRSCNTPPEQTYEGIWLTWEPAGSPKIVGFILKDLFCWFFFNSSRQLNLCFCVTSCSVVLRAEAGMPGVLCSPRCTRESPQGVPKSGRWGNQEGWDVVALSWGCPRGSPGSSVHTGAWVAGKVFSVEHEPSAGSGFDN